MKVKLFESIKEAQQVLINRQPKLVKAMGKNFCVVRFDQEIFAFENECPHMGESLHRGTVNYLGEIVCPLHAYRFNLSSGDSVEKECAPLHIIKVITDKAIYLEI